jgi:hypothetical protein
MVCATQKDAIDAAHPLIARSGGGELVAQDRDGKIRQKDTVTARAGRPVRQELVNRAHRPELGTMAAVDDV